MKTNYILILLSVLASQIAIAQTPDWQWAKRGGGLVSVNGSEVFSTGVERVLDVTIDQNNNYYFLAEVGASQTDYDGTMIQTYSSNANRKDIFVFSTDCQGNFRWSKTIGGGSGDLAISINTDNNNNIYVSGRTRNTVAPPPHFDNDSIKNPALLDGSLEEARKGIFIIKYDDQGNFQWLREPEGPIDQFAGLTQKTVVEPNGRTHSLIRLAPGLHLEGQLNVTSTDPLGESVIVIYDANGNLENFITLEMQPGLDVYDYQLAYDPNLDRYYIADTRRQDGSLSINGFGVTSGEDKAFYLAALDNQGQVVWYHENLKKNSWTLGDIALDDNGDIYLTGKYANNNTTNELDSFAGYTFTSDPNETTPESPFLIKLDSAGNLIWGTNATQDSRFPGRSLTIEGNNVYLGLGSLNNEWDGIPFGNEVSGAGLLATDNAVLRFNKTTGSLEESIDMPGTGFDMIMAMDIDSNGNIVVGGHFGGTLLSGQPQSVTKVGGDTDFFVAQYGTGNCTLGTEELSRQLDIKLYPQPASGMFYLQSQHQLSRYEIFNIQGQSLQSGQLDNSSVDISKFSSGLYFLKVWDDKGVAKVMRLLVD